MKLYQLTKRNDGRYVCTGCSNAADPQSSATVNRSYSTLSLSPSLVFFVHSLQSKLLLLCISPTKKARYASTGKRETHFRTIMDSTLVLGEVIAGKCLADRGIWHFFHVAQRTFCFPFSTSTDLLRTVGIFRKWLVSPFFFPKALKKIIQTPFNCPSIRSNWWRGIFSCFFVKLCQFGIFP